MPRLLEGIFQNAYDGRVEHPVAMLFDEAPHG